MQRIVFVGALLFLSAGVYSAQQSVSPEQLRTPPAKEPTWAFPVQQGSLAAEPGPKKLAGSDKTFTPEEIDNLMAPPDWLPNDHPAAPSSCAAAIAGVPTTSSATTAALRALTRMA